MTTTTLTTPKYSGLPDVEEQRLFARLSVFAGAFSVDEAHAVAAPQGQPRTTTIPQLGSLTERSLLARNADGTDRYRLLRPLRSFARQRLADHGVAALLADRHLWFVVARAEQAASGCELPGYLRIEHHLRYTQGETRTEVAPNEAIALLEEALGLAAEAHAGFIEDLARLTATSLSGRHGEPSSALPAFAELIEHWRRRGNGLQQWTTLRNLVTLWTPRGGRRNGGSDRRGCRMGGRPLDAREAVDRALGAIARLSE